MDLFGFASRPAPPPTAATDKIVPFHYYDDTKHTNGLCFDFTFRFDDVLDDEKLRVALSRLLGLGDWGKLGLVFAETMQGHWNIMFLNTSTTSVPASRFPRLHLTSL